MTNYDKIRNYSKEELVSFLQSVNSDPLFRCKDILSWLRSEDEKPKFLGDDGIFTRGSTPEERKENAANGLSKPCKILAGTTMLGKPYYQIIVDGVLMKVPKACVEYSE